jgi:hypothetical protein
MIMPRLLALLLIPCVLLVSSCEKAEETEPAADNAVGNPAPQAQPEGEKKREGIFKKTTAQVVDMKKALAENPNLIVFKRNGLGNDPLTQYANAYVYLRSEAQMLNMKHQMDILKAMNDDRYPNYEEFMKFVKQHNFQFTMLKPWQKYGYNEDTGSMVILQDEAVKKQRYKEAGIEDQYQEGTP